MELAFLILPPFLHLPRVRPPGSAGGPPSGNGVFSTQIPAKCRRDSKISRALLDELSTLAEAVIVLTVHTRAWDFSQSAGHVHGELTKTNFVI